MKKMALILIMAFMVIVSGSKTAYASTAKNSNSPPGKVKIVSSYKGVSVVKLKWKKIRGADGYKIYMKNGSSYKCVDTIRNATVNTYKKRGLKSGTLYRFKVRAFKKKKGKVIYGKYSDVKKLTTKYGLSEGHFSCKYFSFDFNPDIWDVDECYADQDMIRIRKKAEPGEDKMSWEEREKLKKPCMEFSARSHELYNVGKKIATLDEYLEWEFADWENVVDAPKYIKYGKVKLAGRNFALFGNNRSFSRTYVTLINGKVGKKSVKVPIHIQLSYDSDDHTAYDKKYYNRVLDSFKIDNK